MASSHREAPLISCDPLADNVDVYAFRSPDNPNTVTLIATYIPFQLPQGGPNYYTFGENIRYEIHVDNDASIVGDEITYRFTFNIENEDPTTFFNMRLGKQNQKATYTLERSLDGGQTFSVIVENGIVPPNNIGERSITGGAGLNTTYDALWNGGITTASTGETVFAGPSDDPFFVDLGGIFDLGNAPRQNGKAVDGVGCYNVSTLAIQIPISTLLKSGAAASPSTILDPDYVIGVWASASRPAIQTLSATGAPSFSGDWVQVSRLGMPLTNEAVIPIGYKDFWNSITPYDELAETEMDEFFYNPELALYMDDDLFGGAVPAFGPLRIQKASLGAFNFSNGGDGVSALADGDLTGTAFEAYASLLLIPGKPRAVDLWPIFHTGVPNAIPYQLATGKDGNPLAAGKPFINNFLPNGGDMLRLNMAVPVTPRDDANFSSLGLVQAAAIGLTVAPFNTTADLEFIPNMDGFPNGRRLEDDVTRIELQAVGGVVLAAIGLWYDDYDPANSPSPVTQDLLDVLTYSTGVEANDKPFNSSFPYVAQPFSGTGACSGEIIEDEVAQEMINNPSFFVSSNTSSTIGVYDIEDDGSISMGNISSSAMDADGIYYSETDDVLYQLNRTDNVINAYSNAIENYQMSASPELTATSSSDFTNGREIAVVGNSLTVAQDADESNDMVNKLVTYTISPSEITLSKTNDVSINLWGIHMTANNLYAIIDNSNELAIFEGFLSAGEGTLEPSRTVVIDSMIRTHGITYIQDQDLMILTDVGSGSDPADGAIVTIQNFTQASADGVISMDEQVRIVGASTFLGNPVDVAYDAASSQIFVAERANGGGRVLGFNVTDSGDASPFYNEIFAGASAIYLENYNLEIESPMLNVFDPNFSDDFLISAKLSGSNEVPGVSTEALGVATITFTENYSMATLNATVNGLSSEFAGAHIHFAKPGENGDVVFNFTENYTEGRIQSTFAVTRQDVERFITGDYYLNIHSENFPGGEIRGNLGLEAATSFYAKIEGNQEVPAVDTDGRGLASIHYTSNTNVLEIKVQASGLSGPITGIHLHSADEGANGDVVENLTPYLVGNTVNVKLQAGDYINMMKAGGLYVNIHTAANPGGEIRGQIVPLGGALVFDSWLAGSQEVPALDNNSFGLAIGWIKPSLDSVYVAIVADNTTGEITGAHFHNAVLGENGDVVLNLSDFIMDNMIETSNALPIDESFLSQFLSGDLYLNLHSATFPSGELRGQVYRIARDGYAYDVCQEQEIPSPVNAGNAAGSGMIAFNRDFDEMHMMVVANELSSDFAGAHIHNAATGENGDVIFNMTDRWENGGTFFYVTDEFNASLANMIQSGNTYVNIHTSNNPDGEIRGQIVKMPNCPFSSSTIEIGEEQIGINMYPNPTSGKLILELDGEQTLLSNSNIQIYSISGQLLSEQQIYNNTSNVDVSNLESGVYFLNIRNENFTHSIKFTKID
ncbi:hypothetical protein GCM10007940_00700 [Portibacter lacus]|uniref:CHRD domain-containing protein n=2 Tax=Portibacter lacus TaxID=1099794 RepID=A0AA37SP37_9BACT|nr:hypothetical protein GCM10007940_00700 [Portibacter lacus]